MTNVSLGGEDFDIEEFRAMTDPVQMMFAMRKVLEFKMPPVGLTTHRARFGGYEWVRNTWRCEKPGCYYIVTPRVGDKRSVDDLISHHRSTGDEYRCPTPPRRESLPSGLAEVEKLWREIDDVVDSIKSKVPYRGMSGDGLNGYVKGLAFSIVMKDKDLWPDIKAVSQEAGRRWKMRQGLIPYSSTPTRHENNFSSLGPLGGWQKDKPLPSTKRAAPAKKSAPRKAAPVKSIPADKVAIIKAGLASGMFSPKELADMYDVTEAQVRQLAA